MSRTIVSTATLVLALLVSAGCDSGETPDLNLPDIPEAIEPGNFVQTVDNLYWPLVSGTTFSYAWEGSGGAAMTEEVEVLLETRTVNGVEATVVRSQVFRESALVAESSDWFAQDKDGNVWYMGKDAYRYVNFQKQKDPSSWESGVDGALAGLYMPAEPAVGDYYYQAYDKGEVQDVAEVVALSQDVQVPAGVFKECVEIRETTPLDLDVLENRYFCPGVGIVLTVDVAEGNVREELVTWGGL